MTTGRKRSFASDAKSCTGKRAYASYAEAARIATYTSRKGEFRGRGVHPYKCRACNQWHCGHEDGRSVKPQPPESQFHDL